MEIQYLVEGEKSEMGGLGCLRIWKSKKNQRLTLLNEGVAIIGYG